MWLSSTISFVSHFGVKFYQLCKLQRMLGNEFLCYYVFNKILLRGAEAECLNYLALIFTLKNCRTTLERGRN